jgi:hypothetical protein
MGMCHQNDGTVGSGDVKNAIETVTSSKTEAALAPQTDPRSPIFTGNSGVCTHPGTPHRNNSGHGGVDVPETNVGNVGWVPQSYPPSVFTLDEGCRP